MPQKSQIHAASRLRYGLPIFAGGVVWLLSRPTLGESAIPPLPPPEFSVGLSVSPLPKTPQIVFDEAEGKRLLTPFGLTATRDRGVLPRWFDRAAT